MAAPPRTATAGTTAADGRETALPPVARRRKRKDWGRRVARVMCVLFALVGLLPFGATLVLRSTWAREWAARETEGLLAAQGIAARYGLALRVWPLAVDLLDVRVESSDGGAPLLQSDLVRIRPRLFALLAGKLAIDQVELDVPRVRAVLKDGQLTNLVLKKSNTPSEKPKWPERAPFNAFALTDASIDLDVDDTHVEVSAFDLDVTSEQEMGIEGATFEVALRMGRAEVHHPRPLPEGGQAVDDDVLCGVEGRVRVESTQLLVRRFEGTGSADLDGAPDTAPPCDLPTSDKRRVELSLGHLHVAFPTGDQKLPPVDGHLRVRAPIGLAERAAKLPETDGWIGVDADVRYVPDAVLPDLAGTLEAHDVRLAQYSFAKELHSQLSIRDNIIASPSTTLRFADGARHPVGHARSIPSQKEHDSRRRGSTWPTSTSRRSCATSASTRTRTWDGTSGSCTPRPSLGRSSPSSSTATSRRRRSTSACTTVPPRTSTASACSASPRPRSPRTWPSVPRHCSSRACAPRCRARTWTAASARSASTTICGSMFRRCRPTWTTCRRSGPW